MTNNIRFYEDPTNYTYRMDLLNGSINISRMPGVYNIATGCGSGKTSIIKQIIKDYHNDGVIVFCKTIRECNELYDYTKSISVYEPIKGPGYETRLHEDEIINLCSEPRLEKINDVMVCTNGVNLHWKDNLDMLADKKIIIATHHVLLNSPIDKLMVMNHNSNGGPTSMFEKGLGGRITSMTIRKFMLIDEMPLNEPIKKSFNLSGLMAFMEVHDHLSPDVNNPGNITKRIVVRMKSNYSYGQFLHDYGVAEEFNPDYKFEYKDTELGQARKDMILTALYHTMELKGNKALDPNNRKNSITVKYSLPSMIMTPGINTNIWVFDGTGDLTLSTSQFYRQMILPNKYKGEEVDIIRIPNYLRSRNVNIDKMFSKRDEVLASLEKNIDLLEKIIRSNKETLIIVWKNLKARYVTEDKEYNENLTKYILNDEFNLPEYYKKRLEGRLAGTDHKFHVIHYGSGLDLATNEFRDCDSIVRLGLFQIPNDSLAEINDNLGTEMNMDRFMLYQNVQALVRTRIRNHKGEKVKFYISDDFDRHINNLIGYLSNEGCKVREIDYVMSRVPKKVRENIEKLMRWNGEIEKSILNGSNYSLSININELFDLIPMSVKESRKYNNLVSSLRDLGVTLNIITNDWNKN